MIDQCQLGKGETGIATEFLPCPSLQLQLELSSLDQLNIFICPILFFLEKMIILLWGKKGGKEGTKKGEKKEENEGI